MLDLSCVISCRLPAVPAPCRQHEAWACLHDRQACRPRAGGQRTWQKRAFGCSTANMGRKVVRLALQMRAIVDFRRSGTPLATCAAQPFSSAARAPALRAARMRTGGTTGAPRQALQISGLAGRPSSASGASRARLLWHGHLVQQGSQGHICKAGVGVHQVHLVQLKQPLQHVWCRLEHPACTARLSPAQALLAMPAAHDRPVWQADWRTQTNARTAEARGGCAPQQLAVLMQAAQQPDGGQRQAQRCGRPLLALQSLCTAAPLSGMACLEGRSMQAPPPPPFPHPGSPLMHTHCAADDCCTGRAAAHPRRRRGVWGRLGPHADGPHDVLRRPGIAAGHPCGKVGAPGRRAQACGALCRALHATGHTARTWTEAPLSALGAICSPQAVTSRQAWIPQM